MNENMIKRPGAQRCLMIYFSCYLAHKRDADPGKLDSTTEQLRDLDWVKSLIGQVKPFPSAHSNRVQIKLHIRIALLILSCQTEFFNGLQARHRLVLPYCCFLLINCCHTYLRFRCICPPGYFGTLCDLDVNECEDSPCLHEGICINTRGGFECICRPGYSGSFFFFYPPVTWGSIREPQKAYRGPVAAGYWGNSDADLGPE